MSDKSKATERQKRIDALKRMLATCDAKIESGEAKNIEFAKRIREATAKKLFNMTGEKR